jgi:hypothetical protein
MSIVQLISQQIYPVICFTSSASAPYSRTPSSSNVRGPVAHPYKRNYTHVYRRLYVSRQYAGTQKVVDRMLAGIHVFQNVFRIRRMKTQSAKDMPRSCECLCIHSKKFRLFYGRILLSSKKYITSLLVCFTTI